MHVLAVGTRAASAVESEAVGERDTGDSDYGALTQACWTALPDDGRRVDRWPTDWNNSRYRAAELSYVRLRLGGVIADGVEPAHPALTFGETGAAGAAMAMALSGVGTGRTLITSGAPGSNGRAAIVVDMGGRNADEPSGRGPERLLHGERHGSHSTMKNRGRI